VIIKYSEEMGKKRNFYRLILVRFLESLRYGILFIVRVQSGQKPRIKSVRIYLEPYT